MATVSYVQVGNSIDYTPDAAVSAGDVVIQGDLVGVVKLDIAAGALGALAVSGVFDFPKATSEGSAIAAGAVVYWDVADAVVKEDSESGANKFVGATMAAATDGDATVRVKLLAQSPKAAAIAGAAGVTAEVAAITATDPTCDAVDITDSTGGTPSATHELADCAGSDTVGLAAVEANFATVAAEYNGLKDDVEAAETSLDAAIDDLATQKAVLDALVSTDVPALVTKVNALLAALRGLGIVATA